MSDFYETIAHYYDAQTEHFTDDLPLYDELMAAHNGVVLDVGCGTGRVVLHLAQSGSGQRIVGVDNSAAMLTIAKRKKKTLAVPHLELVNADILKYSPEKDENGKEKENFRLILLSYNALMHFTTPAAQLAVLQHLRGMLADGGLLVIDMPNGGEAFATQDDGAVAFERTFIEPRHEHVVMMQSVSQIDRVEQILDVTWIYDEIQADRTIKRLLAPQKMRYLFASELRFMLQLANFKLPVLYGDYDRSPFEDGCERMIALTEK